MFANMDTPLKQLAQEALRLTPVTRVELADFLVESLNTAQPDELQRLWVAEVGRRLTEIHSGMIKAIPSEGILAEAHRLVKR